MDIHKKKKVKSFLNIKHESFYCSGIFKFAVYFIAFAVSFFILSFSVKAGINSYIDNYAVNARFENYAKIEIDDEVKIVFNQPVLFLKRENISIKPYVDFGFVVSDSKKVLILNATRNFLYETKYEIELKNIRGISGMIMNDKKFVFYTKSEKNSGKMNVLNIRKNKEFSFSKLELSKDRYIPPEVSRPKIYIKIDPKIKEGKYIDIDISDQVMTIFEDGVRINSFLISSGTYGMPTPMGTFKIRKKEPNHWSGYGLWMPYSMNFYGPYYIHELPYWPSGFREGEDHLGMRASHGCIRLGIGPAEYVYDWTEIGTPLYIHK